MKLDDVEKLILLMQKHDLSELQLKEEGWEFSARRGEKNAPAPIIMQAPAAMSGMTPAVAPLAPAFGSTPAMPAVPDKAHKEITAPIVGTFYRSPAPDQPAFKEVGDRVSADDVVCIVEAMKVMNEIKAGVSGIIRKIMVENASPVEFGQALFQVEAG